MVLLKNDYCQIEEVCWKDVSQQVKAKNPAFFNLITQLKPSAHHTFIKARYAYGTKIVDDGVLKFPISRTQSINLESASFPKELREKLDYCPIPLACILQNSNEVFMERDKRVVPLNYFLPGDFFGVFETVDFLRKKPSAPTWTVTSGARSVFMLPKITDASNYKKLKKKHNLGADLPIDLMDQFNIYAELAQNNGGITNWYNEIIFFSKSWFTKNDNTKAMHWNNFYQYLFDLCLSQLDYFRINTEIDLLWQSFTRVLSERSLKPRPYLMNTVKHLISIASGIAVGFRPAIDNSAIPLDLLEASFVADYALKDYAPLFIQPYKLWPGTQKAIYYTLSLPTLGDSSPYTRNPINLIEDQRDIRRLINTLKHIITHIEVQHPGGRVTEILQNTDFAYFHCVPDVSSGILSSEEIMKTDPDFNPETNGRKQKGKFCANAPFMRGVIKITRTTC